MSRDDDRRHLDDAVMQIKRLRTALEEIELRTRAYRCDADWPLVSGIHAIAIDALAPKGESK